jgi:hypothetical protein
VKTAPDGQPNLQMSQATTAAGLRRLRWAVRATLTLGVAVSITANVLHARAEPIAQAIAAWPPLALLIGVDLVSRVPVHRPLLGVLRIVATIGIAGIAAFISYGHMVGVAARYGESGIVPYLLPLSVDGLIVVASISLMELGGRLREIQPNPAPVVSDFSATQQCLAEVMVPSTPTPRGAITVGGAEFAGNGRTKPNHATKVPHPSPELRRVLDAARQASDELQAEGLTVNRDALAARLRRNGHPMRTSRVTELLAALRMESGSK